MASRRVEVPDIGVVVLTKRKGSRSLRLSVSHEGVVRVSLPYWTPYQAGLQFVRAKAEWIVEQRKNTHSILRDGQLVGKAHHLRLVADSSIGQVTVRSRSSEIIVRYPSNLKIESPDVQQAAKKAGVRALRSEAEELLPKRLAQLAQRHGFSYKSVSVRHLKSRWGSCDSKANITLNLFLMQLPWELIDYVLLHELTHTKVLRHGPPFWEELMRHRPQAKQLRTTLRTYQPTF